ncbi:MAG: ABC transporter permease subunit [Pedococcus sp.]
MSIDLQTSRPTDGRSATGQPPRVAARAVSLRRLVAALAVVGPVGWALSRALTPEGAIVNTGGLPLLGALLSAATHPATSPDFLRLVGDACLVTVTYAALGTAGALVVGVLGGFVLSEAAERHRPGPVLRAARLGLRGLLVAARSIHELIWALLLVSVLGLDPLVAVLAIAIPFGAQTAKVFAEILDGVPRHPVEALRASGARSLPALAYGLFPQATPLLLSYSFYRFECAVRSAVVLGVVGVVGLGQELVVSLRSRNWDEVWTLVGAVLLLSAVIDWWSSRVRGDLAVVSCSDWSGGSAATVGRNHSWWARWSTLVAVVGVGFAWFASGVSWSGLVSARTRELTVGLVAEMLPPALPQGGVSALAGAVLDTVAMAVLAMALAVAITLLLGPAASRFRPVPYAAELPGWWRAPRLLGRFAARGLLLLLRSIPPTVWAVLALVVLFPGILPGAVALGLYTAGILGRLVSEAWESVDIRPRDALRAAGLRPSTAAVVAVLPPSMHHLMTYTLYRFEICVRDTAVVGVVGAAGLGRLFAENLAVFRFPVVSMLLLTSFALSVGTEVLGRRIRRAVRA